MRLSNIGIPSIRVLNWSVLVGGLASLLFGAALVCVGAFVFWRWYTAEYTPREFVPYRTALAHVEHGSSFNPGYPSVVVTMEQFRKESAGKPYMLSYPTKSNGSASVRYLMLKSTEVGNIYVVSSEKIPYYEKSGFYGSLGYQERTVYVSERSAFVSVPDGTSYMEFFFIIPMCILGAFLMLAGIAFVSTETVEMEW